MAQTRLAQRGGEKFGAIGQTFVGHDALDADVARPHPFERALKEACGDLADGPSFSTAHRDKLSNIGRGSGILVRVQGGAKMMVGVATTSFSGSAPVNNPLRNDS